MQGFGTLTRTSLHAFALVVALLAGCAAPPPPPKPVAIPVFPPPPEPPRFIWERSIYSSADVIKDDSKTEFRRMVTGESKMGEALAKPYGIAVHRGRVFVTDTVRRSIMAFDTVENKFLDFGIDEPGSVRAPLGIDTDEAGNVYVADGSTHQVHVFTRDGKFLRYLGADQSVKRPAGVAVDAKGTRVYVVDIGGVDSQDHGVRILDAQSGAMLGSLGKRGDQAGEFNLPRDVAIGPDGHIYVVDGGNFRVQVFAADGKFVRTFGSVGRQGGQFSRPKEIAIDKTGRLYVIDAAFGNFQIFTPKGELLLDVGTRSNTDGPARYMLPSGIAVGEDNRVYVVDQYYRRIDVFRAVNLD